MTRPKRRTKAGALPIAWTLRALTDLGEIDDYVAASNPVASARWIARLITTAEAAARSPLAGRIVPELASEDIREVFLRTYRIVYRVRERGILVLAVFEGHRRFPSDVDADE